ncbi:MAG: LamG domain-containing protein, partial [Planctomycetota bacterium]|nr:LamG domain-containing protein [Planctomycetota bacterium]
MMKIQSRLATCSLLGLLAACGASLTPLTALAQQASGQAAGQPAAVAQPAAKAAAKQLDPDTLLYLGVTAGKIRGTGFVDQTGKVRGSIVGNPMKTNLGPGEGFRFSWISISKTTKYGNIIGMMEDNGNAEKGWSLGYTDDAFTFALSSTGSDDGDGKMTYLKGTTIIEADRWYHVAATYDGKAMKLYVNGQLEAQSAEQSGDILYPPKNTGAIACYLDQDEKFPMDGTLLEVKVLGRAAPAAAITEEFVPGVRLSSFQPTPEATLRFTVKPYLQFATRESMTIMSETSRPCTAIVEYGEQLPYSMRTQPST